jgi:hypothetical protein
LLEKRFDYEIDLWETFKGWRLGQPSCPRRLGASPFSLIRLKDVKALVSGTEIT